MERHALFSLLLQFAAGGAAVTAAEPAEARLLNHGQVIRSDDYPAIALRQDQQGTATILLHVDRNGNVASCTIAESSGHPALDEQSCGLYRARARFAPARDALGRPTASSQTQVVQWRLAGDPTPPIPRQPFWTRDTVALSADGRFVDCTSEGTGLAFMRSGCAYLEAQQLEQDAAAKDEQIASFMITETYFFPIAPAKVSPPPSLRNARQIARQTSQIVIGPDGRVSECNSVRYVGPPNPGHDDCSDLTVARFAPASGAANLVATVISTVYARTNGGT